MGRNKVKLTDGETRQLIDSGEWRKDNRNFIKFYQTEWSTYLESGYFTDAEILALIRLFPFCGRYSNVLVDNDGQPMTQKSMAGVIRRSEEQTRRIIKGLELKNAIAYRKIGRGRRYYINPRLYWWGNLIRTDIVDLFREREKNPP